jgi:hypothetical protein
MSLTSTAAPRRHPLRTVNYSLPPLPHMPADGTYVTHVHRCTASTSFKDRRLFFTSPPTYARGWACITHFHHCTTYTLVKNRRLSLTSPPTYASGWGMPHLLPPLHRVYILQGPTPISYSPSHICKQIRHVSLTSTATPRLPPSRISAYSLLPLLHTSVNGAYRTLIPLHRGYSTPVKNRCLFLTYFAAGY